MKPVKCSWVDMNKVRQMLAAEDHGTQARLAKMLGCVAKSTISDWKAALDVVDAIEGKVRLSELSVFQPTHAREVAHHFRKTVGKEWDEETKEDIHDWVQRIEEEELTVQELKILLQDERPKPPREEAKFDLLIESEAIGKWLEARKATWPELFRSQFADAVKWQLEILEEELPDVERGDGENLPAAG